jgi:hypothetical protein
MKRGVITSCTKEFHINAKSTIANNAPMKDHQAIYATDFSVALRNGHYLFNYKMGRVSGVQMQLSIFDNKFSFHVFDLFCF